MRYELGFLGAGNMAEAIVRGAIGQGILAPGQMIASDVSEARRELFASLGVAVTTDNATVVSQSRQIMLAVKPQTLPQIAPLLEQVTDDQIVITIMAGIGTAKLTGLMRPRGGNPPRLIRVMPNTPLMVGLGMSGIALGAGAKPGDEALTLRLFGCDKNKAIVVPEAKIDAITAVSGSGPAYIYYLAEAMEKAARELGLGDEARLLVSQTIVGAARLLVESPDTAAELRRKVTSPGGTTEAALRHMDGNKSIDVVVNAIKAAQKRSVELGA